MARNLFSNEILIFSDEENNHPIRFLSGWIYNIEVNNSLFLGESKNYCTQFSDQECKKNNCCLDKIK